FAVLPLPAAVAIYSAYCAQRFHDPLAFSHANGISWRDSLVTPWQAVAQIGAGVGGGGGGAAVCSARFVLNLGITLAFLAVVVVAWRKLPLSYTAFALAVFAYLLLFMASMPSQAVSGNGRYMLVVFPVFMVLGVWGRRPWVHQLLLVGMLPLL